LHEAQKSIETGLEVVAVWKAVAEVSTLTIAVVEGPAVDKRCHCWEGVACRSMMRLEMVKRLVMEVGPGAQTVPKAVSVKVSYSIPCYWLAVECHCAL